MFLDHIHGVVVSVDYSDYLEVSLTHNRPLLTKCIVVTTAEDRETQRVAAKHDCTILLTDRGEKGFNKGLMIEKGLQQLPQDGWRVHFDADILLPGNARHRLSTSLTDTQCIYGVDRMNVVGWGGYQALINSGWTHRGFEHQHYLNYSVNRAEIGSRLIYGDQGWVPIGYFQLWHSSSEYQNGIRVRPYAVNFSTAAHDDVQFALRWDRSKRVLIPEFLVAHLVTEDTSYGKNWNGRKSKRFGPTPNPSPNTNNYPCPIKV